MRTRATPPFLLADQDSVLAEPWTSGDQGLGSALDHWDPSTDLVLRRFVSVDLERARTTSQIGTAARVAISTVWTASATRLSGASDPMELTRETSGQAGAQLTLEVPAGRAGGDLSIRTALVLLAGDPTSPPIAAKRPGSILWSDHVSVALEGRAARFPVTPLGFAGSERYPADARWALDWDPTDLTVPALGALRLFVNTDHPDITAAIVTGGDVASRAPLTSFVRLDVARALVHAALHNDEFVGSPDSWDEGTLGRLLRDLIQMVWPDTSVSALRDRLATDPGGFDSEINARFPVVAQ